MMRTLGELLHGLVDERVVVLDDALRNLQVTGLTDDSRQVRSGYLFIAVAGSAHDGHDYVVQAQAAGAALILAQRPLSALRVPVLVLPNLAQLRSALAGAWYAHPSHALRVAAVTGTNGKTSVAHYLAELGSRMGIASGYLGTVGWGQPGALQEAALTTVDAITLQQRLAALVEQGCALAALEVSSHALDQERLAALDVDVAVFTNLSRDHLDYHGTLENYANAKRRLFVRPELRAVVTNTDDAVGRQIATVAAATDGLTLVCYGSERESMIAGAGYVHWQDLCFEADGLRGQWCTSWGNASFALPLLGSFAVANVAAALAALLTGGVDFAQAVAQAQRLQGVPGRMERFVAAGQPTVVVDYAHTPDALAQALTALRQHSAQRLVVVFGCGGDRDRGKRSQMGAVSAELADLVYLTSDNPRGEDPEQILDEIAVGLPAGANLVRQVDRTQAITQAITDANASDLVLVAGKGHEDYQEVAGVRRAFSDRVLVRSLLAQAA